jgi:hypothetical protein
MIFSTVGMCARTLASFSTCSESSQNTKRVPESAMMNRHSSAVFEG